MAEKQHQNEVVNPQSFFYGLKTDYPKHKSVHEIFEEYADTIPQKKAVIFENRFLTYHELEAESNKVARFLLSVIKNGREKCIGIAMDKSLNYIIAMLGILKAGHAYVPLDPSFPENRLKKMIQDSEMPLIFSEKRYVKLMNRLQWECEPLNMFLCMDSMNIHDESEAEKNELMDVKLWEYVGAKSSDDIGEGGWNSSYTGQPFSRQEVNECGNNVYQKLAPLLHKDLRVLEIGCSSGISMYRIAPEVGFYLGTDMSDVTIKKNQERVTASGIKNISLMTLPAHKVDEIPEKDFDLVIINSVVQCFHGHNYLRDVIRKTIRKLGDTGHIFIGDIMDQDLKDALISDLIQFKKNNKNSAYKTKTDMSVELFLSRSFWEDLSVDFQEIKHVSCSNKIHTVENELTKFRYDSLLTIDKAGPSERSSKKKKNQYDYRVLKACETNRINLDIAPDNLAYIMYTSGSTGDPKGVMVEHRNIVRLVKESDYVDFTENDRILQTGAIEFDASTFEIWGALLNGGELHLIRKEHVLTLDILKKNIQKKQITVMFMTPAVFNYLSEADLEVFSSLRCLVVGGDVLSPYYTSRVIRKFPCLNLVNGYGPTENTTFSTFFRVNEPFDKDIPIGKPIANSTAYICDSNGDLVPVGEPGELCVGGDGVARGYLNNPDITHIKFINNPFIKDDRIYRTGDLAKWLPDGNIQFLGRIDHQVKVRGFRIELKEIENTLLEMEEIKEAAVIARSDADGDSDKTLCAYIVINREIDPKEIQAYLKIKLPAYMIPKVYVKLDKIPLNRNNKVDVNQLPEAALENKKADHPLKQGVAKVLAEIWAQVLRVNVNAINRESDFFDLGGHSLKAMAVAAEVQNRLDIKIDLQTIFELKRLSELSRYIESKERSDAHGLSKTPKKAWYPLSIKQQGALVGNTLKEPDDYNNVQIFLEVIGDVDYSLLQKALDHVIDRHEILKTYFDTVDRKPVQIVSEAFKIDLEYKELQDEQERISFIKGFALDYDLTQLPLMRAALVKCGHEKYMLLFDFDHIIFDGSSITIFINDLLKFYTGNAPEPLAFDYFDYCVWFNDLIENGYLQNQEQYWRNTFRTFRENDPSTDNAINFDLISHDAAIETYRLDKFKVSQIKKIMAFKDCSMYMIALAIYSMFISRMMGSNNKLLIFSPNAGRNLDPHLNQLVGMFVSSIMIVTDPDKNKLFLDFLGEIKQSVMKVMENQDYPPKIIWEEIKSNSDSGLQHLPFMLGYNNYDNTFIDVPGLDIKPVDIFPDLIKSAGIELLVYEYEDEIDLHIRYATRLFNPSVISAMIQTFEIIVDKIIKNYDKTIGDILT